MSAPTAHATQRTPTGPEAGFTLVESLVSLAILALALTATFAAGSQGLSASARAKLETQAVMEARSLIARVGGDVPLKPGRYAGKTALGHPYRLTVASTASSGNGLKAYEITASIAPANKPSHPILRLQTLRTTEATRR